MLATTGSLAMLRTHYLGETAELLRVAMNATSVTEANLALDLLVQMVPEKACVAACNVREVLKEIPASPFAMRVDEQTLATTLDLTREVASYSKHFCDDTSYSVLTAGNLVLDIVVRGRGGSYYWSPASGADDLVDSGALDLALTSDYLLSGVLELITAMGLVCNPTFYLSMSDWHLENASDMFSDLGQLF